MFDTIGRTVLLSLVVLLFLGLSATPVSAAEGDAIELPGDELDDGTVTCFPADLSLPAVQLPSEAFGGLGNDILDTFPPGSAFVPGDAKTFPPGNGFTEGDGARFGQGSGDRLNC